MELNEMEKRMHGEIKLEHHVKVTPDGLLYSIYCRDSDHIR